MILNRTIVISDIHGHLDEFDELLDKLVYNPKFDKLVLLGDYVDRGPYSKEVMYKCQYLLTLGAIVIKGNHDFMFQEWLEGRDNKFTKIFIEHGGMDTIHSYLKGTDKEDTPLELYNTREVREFIVEDNPDDLRFLQSMDFSHSDENNIFVHAGINPYKSNWEDTSEHDMMWIQDLFVMNHHNQSKKVIFGHTPTSLIFDLVGKKSDDPFITHDKIGIDGGVCFCGD